MERQRLVSGAGWLEELVCR
ncbi:hypothetical protein Pcinc_039911, partial [Petrolisthes cinctipes]